MNEQEKINRYLWRYNYQLGPGISDIKDVTFGHDGAVDKDGNTVECPKEFLELDTDEPVRVAMLKLAQEFRYNDYQTCGLKHYNRQVALDGKPGPATYDMVEMERCGCPDYMPPHTDVEGKGAIGSGPWKGCHDVGDFHASHVRITNAPPSHLNVKYNDELTVFQEVLRRVRESYREIGLERYWSGPGTGDLFLPPGGESAPVQSAATFVPSSDGWIGLAIVGNNSMTCTSRAIWERFLAPFAQSSNLEARVHGWHLLWAHEDGHNCGLGHTNGGIMNPSLNTSSDGRWIGDVAESWMKGRFGGEKVPDDEPGPAPEPDPPDDDDCDCSVFECVIKIVGWAINNWGGKELKEKFKKELESNK